MSGVKAMGTSLKMIKTGSESTDTTISHIQTIGEQTTETEEVDVTTLDSANGAKEYIQGAKDAGSVEITANNCSDGQVAALLAVFNSGATRSWTETYPNGDTLSYNAFISAFTFGEASVDGLLTISMTLRLTGTPTYTEVTESN